MFSPKSILTLSLVTLLSFGVTYSANAECPCNRSNGAMFPQAAHSPIAAPRAAPVYQTAYRPAAPYAQSSYGHASYGYGQMTPSYSSGFSGGYTQQHLNPYQLPSPYQMQPRVVTTPTPPPGTIGQTYKLPSRPVPVEKHPRVGMLDVKIKDAHAVIVHDMNAMRTEDTIDGFKDAKDENIWHFESKPLYPGLDHIYRIQATFKNADGTERKTEKYVRLIMGRVVELTF